MNEAVTLPASSPLVSVVVPCFNQSRFAYEAILSAKAAYAGPLEIVIVNDGSTERGAERTLAALAAQHSDARCRVTVHNQENRGLSGARNAGVARATGAFVQLLDCDDFLTPGKLDFQVRHFASADDLGVSVTDCIYSNDHLDHFERLSHLMDDGNFDLPDFANRWERDFSVPIHCALFRRSLFDTHRFDDMQRAKEDWLFWTTIAAAGVRIGYVGTPGAIYRVHDASLCRAFPEIGRNWLSAAVAIDRIVRDKVPDFLDRAVAWYEERYAEPEEDEDEAEDAEANADDLDLDVDADDEAPVPARKAADRKSASKKSDKKSKKAVAEKKPLTEQELEAKAERRRQIAARRRVALFRAFNSDAAQSAAPIALEQVATIATDAPRVTILVPVYEHYAYLDACIRSALAQMDGSVELVLVDDCSQDQRIRPLLEQLAALPGVRALFNDENLGVSETLNRGLAAARGEYVAFLDCDDVLVDDAIAQALAYIDASGGCDYFFSDQRQISVTGETLGVARYGGYLDGRFTGDFRTDLLNGMVASHLKIIRRTAIERCGGFESGESGVQDWSMALKIAQFGTFLYLPKPLYKYRVHERTVTSSDRRGQFHRTNVVRRAFTPMIVAAEPDRDHRPLRVLRPEEIDPRTLPRAWAERRLALDLSGGLTRDDLWVVREFNSYFDSIYWTAPELHSALVGYVWSPDILARGRRLVGGPIVGA